MKILIQQRIHQSCASICPAFTRISKIISSSSRPHIYAQTFCRAANGKRMGRVHAMTSARGKEVVHSSHFRTRVGKREEHIHKGCVLMTLVIFWKSMRNQRTCRVTGESWGGGGGGASLGIELLWQVDYYCAASVVELITFSASLFRCSECSDTVHMRYAIFLYK